ncbi:MAG: hypothetical protein JRF52_06680, partial [Deltaproteobacteria bacterium]|nr:hypothetical protein [Deltaproteobacteria bacterium]
AQRKGAPYGKGGPLDLDAKGWIKSLEPGQWADATVCREGGHYPGGEYVCLYDGEGKIEFDFDAKIKIRQQGRIVLNVSPSNRGILLRIVATDPQDPVRNIRVISSGFEKNHMSQVFHPEFLKRWSGFKVIRFMDWMRTNNSVVETWAERPTTGLQTQGSDRGVALEYMILLANRLKASPWFCMPHEATHGYVENFAKMVKEKLNPSLKVYVEYSNEVWNSRFQQARYAGRVGQGLDLSKDPFEAGLFFYAKRAKEIFQIWEDVFGGPDRLVRVLAAQSTNSWTSEKILGFDKAYKNADVLAIAPYFGGNLGKPDTAVEVVKMSLQGILDLCRVHMAIRHKEVAEHAAVAEKHGLDLIAYEGGQHLVGTGGAENNAQLTALFIAANRDLRMKELYLEDLGGWKKAGGGLFAAFSSMSRYGKWGSWGLLENQDQNPAGAPKYQAILEFMGTPSVYNFKGQ